MGDRPNRRLIGTGVSMAEFNAAVADVRDCLDTTLDNPTPHAIVMRLIVLGWRKVEEAESGG